MPWYLCHHIRANKICAMTFPRLHSHPGICATAFLPWHLRHGMNGTAFTPDIHSLSSTAFPPPHSRYNIYANAFPPQHLRQFIRLRHSGHSIRAFVPRHLWHGIFATHSIFAMALATSHLHHNICTLAFFATAFMQWYSRT